MLVDIAASIGALCLVGVILTRLAIAKVVNTVYRTSMKAVRIIRTNTISDHWKERVMPIYSAQMLIGSLKLAASLIAILLIFAIGFTLVQGFVGPGFEAGMLRLLLIETQIITVLVSVVLGLAYFTINK